MTEEIYQRKNNIGRKILTSSRDNLYFAMRYLDMALCAFEYAPVADNHCAGTDGNVMYYYPDFLMELYEREVRFTNRLYLHMTLHCIYRHLFRIEDRDRQLWDVCCDIAVESVIDGLNYSCINMRLPAVRDRLYNDIRREYKVITADTAYRYLDMHKLSNTDMAAMENEFKMDDHNYWYKESPKSQTRQQNRQKWDDISQRMQTSMETVEKGAGHEDAGMYSAVQVENRKKYDYKEFLRKFAVYQEEMQVDPDSFDYAFYTYGLQLFGNMPLIEPLEQKEVKKIQDFVIVIDTSFSCSEEQVKDFLAETCQILFSTESFFKKVNIRILQADNKIQKDDRITSQEEMTDYINHLTIKGRGGTDFRPAFQYVSELIDNHEFMNLKGLLYFTDGRGEYPKRRTPYDTAFIFLHDDFVDSDVPSWAIKLEI